jgi:hypothetical protein
MAITGIQHFQPLDFNKEFRAMTQSMKILQDLRKLEAARYLVAVIFYIAQLG